MPPQLKTKTNNFHDNMKGRCLQPRVRVFLTFLLKNTYNSPNNLECPPEFMENCLFLCKGFKSYDSCFPSSCHIFSQRLLVVEVSQIAGNASTWVQLVHKSADLKTQSSLLQNRLHPQIQIPNTSPRYKVIREKSRGGRFLWNKN